MAEAIFTAEEIFKKLQEKFGDKIAETDTEPVEPVATVEADAFAEVCTFLKNDPELDFKWLSCLSAIDEDEERLRVVYHLESLQKGNKVKLQVFVPKADPKMPSVAKIWRTADWHEREAYDLLGVTFEGHPDFRRILLPDDWEGHPLRKDYVVQETYRGLQVPYDKPEESAEDNNK